MRLCQKTRPPYSAVPNERNNSATEFEMDNYIVAQVAVMSSYRQRKSLTYYHEVRGSLSTSEALSESSVGRNLAARTNTHTHTIKTQIKQNILNACLATTTILLHDRHYYSTTTTSNAYYCMLLLLLLIFANFLRRRINVVSFKNTFTACCNQFFTLS